MKNLIPDLLAVILATLFLVSCSRSEADSPNASSSGYFSITKSGGSTFKTSYDGSVQIPTKPGTFSLQYNKTSGENLMFFVLIDNNNDCGLDVISSTPIKTGVTYTGSSVSLYGSLANVNINYNKLNVIFTNYSYPGRISGNYTAYNQSGSVLYSGDFDLTTK